MGVNSGTPCTYLKQIFLLIHINYEEILMTIPCSTYPLQLFFGKSHIFDSSDIVGMDKQTIGQMDKWTKFNC